MNTGRQIGKLFFFLRMGLKCQQCRSNSSLINYTENLWTSKCHRKTAHMRRSMEGIKRQYLYQRGWFLFLSEVPYIHQNTHKRASHSTSETRTESDWVPVCPPSIYSFDRSGHPYCVPLIATKPLCKNKLTWHPAKWRLWNGNVCHTKVLCEMFLCVFIFPGWLTSFSLLRGIDISMAFCKDGYLSIELPLIQTACMFNGPCCVVSIAVLPCENEMCGCFRSYTNFFRSVLCVEAAFQNQ